MIHAQFTDLYPNTILLILNDFAPPSVIDWSNPFHLQLIIHSFQMAPVRINFHNTAWAHLKNNIRNAVILHNLLKKGKNIFAKYSHGINSEKVFIFPVLSILNVLQHENIHFYRRSATLNIHLYVWNFFFCKPKIFQVLKMQWKKKNTRVIPLCEMRHIKTCNCVRGAKKKVCKSERCRSTKTVLFTKLRYISRKSRI